MCSTRVGKFTQIFESSKFTYLLPQSTAVLSFKDRFLSGPCLFFHKALQHLAKDLDRLFTQTLGLQPSEILSLSEFPC